MKPLLSFIAASGITSAHFSAKLAGISNNGHVILTGLDTPLGRAKGHFWIPATDFSGFPATGKRFSFVADVTHYWKNNFQEMDFGLRHPRQIEVIG